MSTAKISLINNIGTPTNYPRNYTVSIKYSGANIHIDNEDTPKMAPVTMSNSTPARRPYRSTMESSYVATLQLQVLNRKAIQIHIYPKMITAQLI